MLPCLRAAARLAACAVLAACGAAAAEPGDAPRALERERGRPFLQAFAPGDYRGHQQVYAIAQTSRGLITFSNYGAVCEYDGARWREVRVPTSWIRELAADEAGRVWLGGVDELGWTAAGADGATRYHSLLPQVPAECLPLGAVWTVAWHEGAAWFATDRHVLRWDGARFQSWSFPAAPMQRLRRGGRDLWLTRRDDALYRWQAGEWRVVSRAPEATASPVHLVIDDGPGGRPLLGTEAGQLWQLAPDGAVTEFVPALREVFAGARITGGARLGNGLLAVTTRGRGLVVLAADGRLVQRLDAEDGLPSSTTYSVHEDTEGGVWVGTSMGAVRLELGSPYTIFDRQNGRGASLDLHLARSGGVLFAGSDEGLRRLEVPAAGRARFERVPGLRAQVFALLDGADGLLAGTDAGLAQVVDGELRVAVPSVVPVLALARSAAEPGRIFVGFPETVSTYVRRGDGTWHDEGRIAAFSGEARTIFEAGPDTLWVGTTQRGFARLVRPAGGPWRAATAEYFRTGRGLPAEPGWVRVVGGPGGPWFTTAQGVFSHDGATQQFVPAEAFVANQLAGLYTWPVGSARAGEVWAQLALSADPTDLERPRLGRLAQPAGGAWAWTPLPERVVARVGYFGAYEMLAEPGVVWLSGQTAIVRVETDGLAPPTRPTAPPLLWRGFQRGSDGLLPVDGSTPELAAGRGPLRVEFASPGFSAGGAADYSYRILGYDAAWSPWRAQPELALTGLPAGRYTLEVRARTSREGPPAVAALAFVLRAPWYLQPWMLGLYGVTAVGGLVAVVRGRSAALLRQQARLEQLVAERTQEWREATQRAETASQAKTMFLAGVSHELRTPLHAILGYAQLLEADRTLPQGARDRLRIVGASGRHLLRLINEVLDLSKIEAGKQELRAEPFDLPALLVEVAEAQETRAQAKGLGLQRPLAAGLPSAVIGDGPKLRQILDNLLGNAVKFTRTGQVRLEAVPLGGRRVRFEVSDTGPGIAAADLERLFEPFSQAAGNELAGETSGTGLGLAIARRLVALMGGELRAASDPGRGARFWFELEFAEPVLVPDLAHEAPRLTGYDGPRRRVLVVDDVEANRQLLADLLAPLDFDVQLAASAEAALSSIEAGRPDLLILDLRLPGMDGLTLARRLRADPRLEGLRILAASASVLGHDPREALAAGCDRFLSKPFLTRELFAVVAELLALTWRAEAVPVPVAGRLAPAELTALEAAARTGDVLAMREALARLRRMHGTSGMIPELERCVQVLDCGRIAALVAAERARPLEGSA